MKILAILFLSFLANSQATAQCWQFFDMQHNEHIILRRYDGTLWACGSNGRGQLGDSTQVQRYMLVQIGSDTNWVSAYTGGGHSTAIKSDGTVWTWGSNYYGVYGDGTSKSVIYPKYTHVSHDWKQFYPSSNQNFVLKQDGTIWNWGDNFEGELGDGSTGQNFYPSQMGTGNIWKSISPGYHHIHGIMEDGTLWGWGHNGWGDIGTLGVSGFADLELNPKRIGTDSDWMSVAGGWVFTVAIKTDGTLWTTGLNDLGQLGDGSTGIHREEFRQISSESWLKATAGKHHALALKSDGTIWAWGHNGFGQLGNGTYEDSNIPKQVGTDNDWVDIEIGQIFSLAQKSDGTIWTWGGSVMTEFVYLNEPMKISCNDPDYVPVIAPPPPIEKTGLTIFPNPVKDVLYIENNTDHPIEQVMIFSPTGQIVMVELPQTNQLNVAHLTWGTYFIRIFQNGTSSVHKFVKR